MDKIGLYCAVLIVAGVLAGCTSNFKGQSTFCAVEPTAHIFNKSSVRTMTARDRAWLRAHHKKGEEICGWKPATPKR